MTLVERTVVGPPPPPTKTSRTTGRWRSLPVVPVAVLVALILHLLWWRFLATTGGDIAAQDAWAEFARTHPGSAYNFAWYGGMHPVSYSVLSPYLMAVLGVRPTMVIAGALSAGLLARLFTKMPGIVRPAWPAWYAAVVLTGDAISGRVTFALGSVFGLGVLCVLFAWPERWHGDVRRWPRGVLAGILAALATACSPVAGLFLGLVAAPLWLSGRRAAAYAVGLPPVAVVVASAMLFPFSGEQPMSWISIILPIIIGASVVLFVPESWRTVRLGGAVYIVAVLLAWLVPSPIGTNIARLGLLFGGLALVAAAVSDRPGTSLATRWTNKRTGSILLMLAIVTSTIWQIGMAGRDAAHSSPPASWSVDLQPLVKQLESRDADIGRVEVVPTRSHREAAALAPTVNLARGWNRQADADRNPIFYDDDHPLTASAYKRWLDRWAVRYVVLSTAEPDPAAVSEAALVTNGLPYLQRLWSNADWTLFAVRNPTPLVSAPARTIEFNAAEITVSVPRGGSYVVRVADSPWLSLVNASGEPLPGPTPSSDGEPSPCLTHVNADQPPGATPHRDDWLILDAPAAGVYRIAAPYKLPRGTACH